MNGPTRGFARAAKTQCRFAGSTAARTPRRTPSPVKGKGTPLFKKPTRAAPRPVHVPKPHSIPEGGPLPDPSAPDTLASLWKRSWIALSGASIVAGFLGYYAIGTTVATLKAPGSTACAACGEHTVPTGRPPALDGDNAEQFDKTLDLGEWWMGITSLRKRIAAAAEGEVLELAMGTGRNLEYYDWEGVDGKIRGKGITTFTGLDISVDMLDVARRKLTATVPMMKGQAPVVRASTMADRSGGQLSYLASRLRLVNSDAHHPLPAPPSSPTAKYDTIIQTFGLCSVSDPVAVLANLATAVKPETGRIVLLEHGKGYFGFMNALLDRNAGRHFEKYGCWWNRDIQGLVEEAVERTPGLEVVKVARPNISQMGTMVWVELKVTEQKPEARKQGEPAKGSA